MTEREIKKLYTIPEDNEQITVISWCKVMEHQWPELALIHHIPNGGKRGKAEAVRFRAMGVLPGVADLFLPVPRCGYHGLYIEMKALNGRVSPDQKKFLTATSGQGFCCCVCFGADAAIAVLTQYMAGAKPMQSGGVIRF